MTNYFILTILNSPHTRTDAPKMRNPNFDYYSSSTVTTPSNLTPPSVRGSMSAYLTILALMGAWAGFFLLGQNLFLINEIFGFLSFGILAVEYVLFRIRCRRMRCWRIVGILRWRSGLWMNFAWRRAWVNCRIVVYAWLIPFLNWSLGIFI